MMAESKVREIERVIDSIVSRIESERNSENYDEENREEKIKEIESTIKFVSQIIELIDNKKLTIEMWVLNIIETNFNSIYQGVTDNLNLDDYLIISLLTIRIYCQNKLLDAQRQNLKSETEGLQEKINTAESQLKNYINKVSKSDKKIKEIDDFYNKLKGNDNEESDADKPSIEHDIESIYNKIQEKNTKIEDFYQNLLENDDSIKSNVKSFITEYLGEDYEPDSKPKQSKREQFDDLIEKYKTEINEQSQLREELEKLQKEYNKFKEETKNYFNDIRKTITDLLPGATQASLGYAFFEQKNDMQNLRMKAEWWFFGGVLTLCVVIVGILAISVYDAWQMNESIFSLDRVFNKLVFSIPISLPIIWFCIDKQNKIKTYLRLEQEYTHKYTVSASFDSYRKQIEQLKKISESDEDDNSNIIKPEKLLGDLFNISIESIGSNAANILEKQQESDTPVDKLVKKIEPAINFLEKLKKLMTNDNK